MFELKKEIVEKYDRTAEYLQEQNIGKLDTAIVAGSGFADFFDNWEILQSIDYIDIPSMPKPGVAGHSGKLLIAKVGEKRCLLFMGRSHLYEGRTVDEICALSIISHLLGIRSIIFTNAAGGLSPLLNLGDAMLINNTINLLYKSESEIFTEKQRADNPKSIYSAKWLKAFKNKAVQDGIHFREGVYLSTSGPSYETPAEIRFFRKLGADAAGMSTVLEAGAAARLGMRCIAISLITNCLKEVRTQKVSHEDILEVSIKAKPEMSRLLNLAVLCS